MCKEERQNTVLVEETIVELLTVLRHDLKNKLLIMTGHLQLLDETELDDDQKYFVEKTSGACKKTFELLEKIGLLKEIIQRGKISNVNLSSKVTDAIYRLEETALDSGFQIESDIREIQVKGYHFMEDLFVYLIENALKHSRGSLVRITSFEDDERISVIVEDDGIGVSAEERYHVFKAGYKGIGSSGFGLGLYMVDIITRACGGRIVVSDSELGGASFEVILNR